jgi:hypothetical protein
MKRRWLVVSALLVAHASARQPETPTAFRFERPIVSDGRGARRLPIDVPLLVGGNPGLGDLRLVDAGGRELGYLLVPKPPVEPVWKPAAILPVASVDTEKQKTSGFEADLGEAFTVDRFRIDGVAPPFLKRVRLEGSGDRAHWTLLVGEGTVFDLPDEKLRQTELAFTPGSYRYFRITWDDTNSGRLPRPPAAIARIVSGAAPPPPLTTVLAVERRPSEPGRSRYRVRLPGGHLPIVALDLDIGGGHVLRNAAVYEARLSGTEAIPVVLGTATLRRVIRGSLSAASLRVPISPPLEAQLDLVVDDGDNPPLELRAVQAIFAEQPWIYFESDGGPLVARYGNPSLGAPRYDLEAVRDTLRIDAVAGARWGDARARTSEENAAGNAPPLPTVGSSLDTALFDYVRAIPSGDAGLIALPLDAAVLAHSAGRSGSFADLRVIDADRRQVPYLIERASEPLSLDLKLERLSKPPKTLVLGRAASTAPSVYRVAWPFERLPASRLVLSTSARVFQRSVAVGVEREPNRRIRDVWIETIATAAWVHADQDKPTPALALSLPTVGANELLVIVEEGDNTPLPLTAARVLLPAYRLRFFRDRGAVLRLAYGRPDLAPPRYDLALLAPQVLGVAATEIAPAAEAAPRSTATTAAIVSPRVFWAVLAVAVLVLVALIVRLIRKEGRV